MNEEKLSKKEYEEYIFLKQLRNNELAKIVRNKMYKQKLTADNMIVLQEKQLNKYKSVLDKIKEIVDKAPCLWYVDEELERVDGTIDLTYEEYTGWKNILELLEKIK